MTTVDHAHLDRLEARARIARDAARQALTDGPPPADRPDAYRPEMAGKPDAYLSGVLEYIADMEPPPTRWMRAAIAEAATRLYHP